MLDHYYAIDVSLNPIKVATFESAIKMNPAYIVMAKFSFTHTTSYGNDYQIFNYSFLDKDKKEIKPNFGKWVITAIHKGRFIVRHKGNTTWWGDGVSIDFNDPFGELKTIPPIFSIKELCEFIRVIIKFKSWAEYEMKEQIDELLKEKANYLKTIEGLTEKVNNLENDLRQLNANLKK